jgi:hypothetical protein
MNLAERRLITRALGPAVMRAVERVDVRPEPGAWRALARAVILSAGDVVADPRGRAILAAICRKAVVANDDRVPGRIGERRLSEGCYSFNEAMTLAAAHLKQTGRAGLALSLLQQGWTVRQLLRQFYGIDSGPSWDDAAERRAFRRTLQRSTEAVN